MASSQDLLPIPLQRKLAAAGSIPGQGGLWEGSFREEPRKWKASVSIPRHSHWVEQCHCVYPSILWCLELSWVRPFLV